MLTADGDIWLAVAVQHGIAEIGTMSSLPSRELINIGPGKGGFPINFTGLNDGMRYEEVVLLDRILDKFQIIFNELIGLNNAESCASSSIEECWGYSSSLEFIRNGNLDYDDLQISTNGTIIMDDGSMVTIN